MTMNMRSFISLAFFSLAIAATGFSDEQDPLLTEKSTETFTVNMGGLQLLLPVELRKRAVPVKISEQQTDLSIGSIDITYEFKDEKTSEVTPVSAWVDFQAQSLSCDVDKNLETVRAALEKSNVKLRFEQISNDNFDGYILTEIDTTEREFNGLILEVFDKKVSKCFSVSLAYAAWGQYTRAQVRSSISPLVHAIKKSMTDYSQKGTPQ